MSLNNKDENLKEKLRQALSSTIKVISDDFTIQDKDEKNKSSKRFDFFEIDNLNSKIDFIKARAETDSLALKKKFSNEEVYKKNYITKSQLLELAEKYSNSGYGKYLISLINECKRIKYLFPKKERVFKFFKKKTIQGIIQSY